MHWLIVKEYNSKGELVNEADLSVISEVKNKLDLNSYLINKLKYYSLGKQEAENIENCYEDVVFKNGYFYILMSVLRYDNREFGEVIQRELIIYKLNQKFNTIEKYILPLEENYQYKDKNYYSFEVFENGKYFLIADYYNSNIIKYVHWNISGMS